MPEKKIAVEAENIAKSFGKTAVLRGVNLHIYENEVFGLIGPNGAGKSTFTKILMGLLNPDSGKTDFFGFDLKKNYRHLKKIISIVPQELSFYRNFTVRQNLNFFGTLYGLKGKALRERREFLLEWLELKGFENRKAEYLSGGYQRLLNIACSLVNDPAVVFLDEPTVGLDPEIRKMFWEKIQEMKGQGKTICLTTHYLDEAEYLCDRVGMIDYGILLVCDSPQNLISNYGGYKILSVTLDRIPEIAFVDALKTLLVGSEVTSIGNVLILGLTQERAIEKISMIINWIVNKGYKIKSSVMREPELEDVFTNLTGRLFKE